MQKLIHDFKHSGEAFVFLNKDTISDLLEK